MEKHNLLFTKEITPFIIPKEKVVVVEPEWSLERALLVLTRKGTTSVPVIHPDGRVEGIISKTNILDFLMTNKAEELDFSRLKEFRVLDAMDRNHMGIMANSIFSFAFEVLVNRSYIPIIDIRHQFVGILTRKVMMEKVIEYFHEEYLQTVSNE
jgi:CBS-domain-containing membrane protein